MNLNVKDLNFIWKRIERLSATDRKYLQMQLNARVADDRLEEASTATQAFANPDISPTSTASY